jgi:hypothetical protein
MKEHHWSNPICIYECAMACKCSGCGAVCFAAWEPDNDNLTHLRNQPIPKDCDEAHSLVLDGYFQWDFEDPPPWLEDDRQWVWDD